MFAHRTQSTPCIRDSITDQSYHHNQGFVYKRKSERPGDPITRSGVRGKSSSGPSLATVSSTRLHRCIAAFGWARLLRNVRFYRFLLEGGEGSLKHLCCIYGGVNSWTASIQHRNNIVPTGIVSILLQSWSKINLFRGFDVLLALHYWFWKSWIPVAWCWCLKFQPRNNK